MVLIPFKGTGRNCCVRGGTSVSARRVTTWGRIMKNMTFEPAVSFTSDGGRSWCSFL
jgi:hypothetical protein